jgi:hypothetical protein
MEYLQAKQEEILDGIWNFFAAKIEENPAATLSQIDNELKSLYIRFDHGWVGRGIVGDTTQGATIAALEAVRAECLDRVKKGENGQQC